MKRSFAALAMLIAGAVALVLAASPAAAQPTERQLDEIRAEIPRTDPGEIDLISAESLYNRLAGLYGPSLDVAGDGASLSGPCGGFAISYDDDGDLLDAALDVGDERGPVDLLEGVPAFSRDNPFEVEPNGTIAYFGFAPRVGEGPTDHTWAVRAMGVKLRDGGGPNDEGISRVVGHIDLDDELLLPFTAIVELEGELDSRNVDRCFGDGHVDVQGRGLVSAVGIAGLVAMAFGGLGLLVDARPKQVWRSAE